MSDNWIKPVFTAKSEDVITCGGISEASKMIAVGSNLGPISLFKEGSKEPRKILCCSDSVRSIQFNESGDKMLICDKSGDFFLYNLTTDSVEIHQVKAHKSPLEVARYITETIIATGDSDGHVKVWDISDTPKILRKFHDEQDYVSDIAPVDDKHFGVTTGNGVLSLYAINRPKRKQYYAQEDDDFVSLTYNYFCSYFVCASSRPKIYVSKFDSLDFVTENTMKSTKPFVSVRSFKLNKCRVVVAADNGIVYISDVNPNNLIYAWEAHKKELAGMELSGAHIMTWNQRKEIKVWDLTEKRDEEFMSARKKKRLKLKGKLKRINKKRDTFFDDLGESSDSD